MQLCLATGNINIHCKGHDSSIFYYIRNKKGIILIILGQEYSVDVVTDYRLGDCSSNSDKGCC